MEKDMPETFETFAPARAPSGRQIVAEFFQRGFIDDAEPMRVDIPGSVTQHAGTAKDIVYAQRLPAARAECLAELNGNRWEHLGAVIDAWTADEDPANLPGHVQDFAHAAIAVDLPFLSGSDVDQGAADWRQWCAELLAEFSTDELIAELEQLAAESEAFADGWAR
jgi:hypothetical protein